MCLRVLWGHPAVQRRTRPKVDCGLAVPMFSNWPYLKSESKLQAGPDGEFLTASYPEPCRRIAKARLRRRQHALLGRRVLNRRAGRCFSRIRRSGYGRSGNRKDSVLCLPGYFSRDPDHGGWPARHPCIRRNPTVDGDTRSLLGEHTHGRSLTGAPFFRMFKSLGGSPESRVHCTAIETFKSLRSLFRYESMGPFVERRRGGSRISAATPTTRGRRGKSRATGVEG